MLRNILLFILSVPVFFILKVLGFTRNVIVLSLHREWDELSDYFFSCAHGEDIAACSYVYRTTYKSISGVTGLKVLEESRGGVKNSYIYFWANLIDWLFTFDPNHTYKTGEYEFPDEFKEKDK
jgi:hypothetical protein